MGKRTGPALKGGPAQGYRRRTGRPRRRWWLAGTAALAVALGAWVDLRAHGAAMATGRVGTAVGDVAPTFAVQDIQGQTVTLAVGRPTLLYFVAAWCSSCAYGEGQLRQLHDEAGPRLSLITVDVDPQQDTPQMVAAFAADYGGPWPAVLDVGQRITELYRVTSLDSSYLVNGQGVIAYAAKAPLAAAAWEARLRPLLSSAGSA
jgi:thiol-disulfide isomerase/thioredoxin